MKIYGTTEITYQIEQLIKEESSFIIFVSPYLKLNKRLRAKMNSGFKEINQVLFLFRENELSKTENSWLLNQENVTLIPIQNLHAKIYLNEHKCLITSMNLYEYSQVNNHEIGIELDSKNNRKEFYNVLEEINLMIEAQSSKFYFQQILDSYFEYTIGKLFDVYLKKYSLSGGGKNDEYYQNFCNWARKTVTFEKNEIYQDNTAILRSTNLGRKRFETLKKAISKEILTTHNTSYI